MNIEEYAELLETKEWQEKREAILKRDDYTCQKCGHRGFSFRSFKISGFRELEMLLEGWTVEGNSIVQYLKNIKWSIGKYTPMLSFERKYLRDSRWLISFKDNKKNIFSYVSDNVLLPPSYLKCEFKDLGICNKENNISKFIGLYAFKLNYNSFNNYVKIFKDKGDIVILINDKLFVLRTNNRYDVFRYRALNFKTLHIHHKYYIEDKFPWEYDNDALITLCSDCHSETHEKEKTPLFDKYGNFLIPDLPICDRCYGRGELPQYKYYMNGVCFKCCGSGVLNIK